jgi:hypothetical protein
MDRIHLHNLRVVCGINVPDEPSWLKIIWDKLHVPPPNPENFKCIGYDTPLSKDLLRQHLQQTKVGI